MPATQKLNLGPRHTPSEDIRDAERYRAIRAEFVKDMAKTECPISAEEFDLQTDEIVEKAAPAPTCTCGQPDAPNTQHCTYAPCHSHA